MNPARSENADFPPPSPDQRGEWISAYLDGELSPSEETEVGRWLADDPAAARLAADLRGVRQAVRESPAPAVAGDLRSAVLAEALRRQAAGEGEPVTPASQQSERLEPEGDFGLPFGRSARSWGWAGVAVAAAVLISFFGRPERPGGTGAVAQNVPRPTQQLAIAQQRELARQRYEHALRAMRQATPGLQVVNYEATPQTLQRLRERLAAGSAKLPSEWQSGAVVEPVEASAAAPPLEEGEEQLFYVDADEAELNRLLGEVEGESGDSVFRVGADQGAAPPNPPASREVVAARGAAAPTPIRAVRLRLNVSPEALAKLKAEAQNNGSQGDTPRRLVVLRIRVAPAATSSQP